MQTIRLGANEFSYDSTGAGPVLLLLSGWCQDHRLFKTLVPRLADRYRVIRLDWRGHGLHRDHDGDFTVEDQADDVVRFLDTMGIEKAVPVSTSHGGWANIAVTDRLGAARIPASIVIDWIMVEPDAGFFGMIDALQIRENWESGREDFFRSWIEDTDNQDVIRHVNDEMAGYSFEMWARSGREIASAYRRWGSPMQRMRMLQQHRPIAHIFSQPVAPEYHAAQLDFAAANPWFRPIRLEGRTHFPTLEQPQVVAASIDAVLGALPG